MTSSETFWTCNLKFQLVERLIKRQQTKWSEVGKTRLAYIKLRNKVTEKRARMKSFDQIGPNLHLIDYEQLKVENQSHVDKIEEREDELLKLRTKCSGAIQCLAHVREKSAALEVDIISLRDTLEDVQMDYTDVGQNLSYALGI